MICADAVKSSSCVAAIAACFLLACGPAADTEKPDNTPIQGADAGIDITAETVCTPGETIACYQGPDGTEGVGVCQAGTQTCSDKGTAWTGCQGQTLPGPENCDDGFDDDCNGVADDVSDLDGDGYTVCDGDCCETSSQCGDPASVNPGAVEVVSTDGSESTDENCNGEIDETAAACDEGIALDDNDPMSAAHAIDLCQAATGGSHGIISAKYSRANGAAIGGTRQYGIQASFGDNVPPQRGGSMLALSSGAARTPGQSDSCGMATCTSNWGGTAPAGFPQDVPGCSGSAAINDDVALELKLRAPANATGYSFDFMFYSFEYPEYICTAFNDQFIALVDPPPPGSINGNIAFDSQTNPVSVNIAYFDVCEGCPAGTAALEGTGFDSWDDAGATTWLRTQAPIEGGAEFTIRFTIWDTGDTALDSTVLIDNFQWLAEPVGVGTDIID